MPETAVNLRKKLSLFNEHWSPKVVAALNDYQVKVAKVSGEFEWHEHADTDELFLVVQGELDIYLKDGCVTLREGEMYVVPRGVAHKPVAQTECHIVLIEPAGVRNTGTQVTERTAPNDEWI